MTRQEGNFTLAIIKPDAVHKNYVGNILSIISKADFRLSGMKLIRMSIDQAEEFYAIHREKSFFEALVQFMSSGPSVVALLKRENAVNTLRDLMGPTDPLEAASGTIRNLYGETIRKNAIHGSDTDEHAKSEADFFFSQIERYNW